MLHLSNADVAEVLDMPLTVSALKVGFDDLRQGLATHVPRIDVYAPTGRSEDYYRWGGMTGVCTSYGVLAVRLKSDVMSWTGGTQEKYCIRPGLYSGVILLYSITDGEPLAIINDGYLQHMRVGGAAGIGTDLLARADAAQVAVLGSGGMAAVYLEAVAQVRQLSSVRVYSPTVDNRERFATTWSARLGLPVEPVSTAKDAVDGADIVLSATDSRKPTFEASWLRPGTHVTTVHPQEVDADILARADIVVQLGHGTITPSIAVPGMTHLAGGFASFVAGTAEDRARIPRSRVSDRQHDYPMLFDYAGSPAPVRRGNDDITLFLNWGTQGLQFASVAGATYRAARDRGLGRGLPDEVFLQDIRD
jgi:alanine dehydrogenase